MAVADATPCLLQKQLSRHSACTANRTFGCFETAVGRHHYLWVRDGCRGIFSCEKRAEQRERNANVDKRAERTRVLCGDFRSSAYTTCSCSAAVRPTHVPVRMTHRWSEYAAGRGGTGQAFSSVVTSSLPSLPVPLVRCFVEQSRAQFGEDHALFALLLAIVGPGTAGAFVEIGAYDGVTWSNTFALEECLAWRGVLIEANSASWDQLQQKRRSCATRRSTCLHAAVCQPSGEMYVTGRSQEVSGSPHDMTHRYLSKWKRFNHADEPSSLTAVPCAPMSELLAQHTWPSIENGQGGGAARGGRIRVHLLSIDVEGAEERVLQTTNLSEVAVALVEMDGTSPLRDARKHRHMLLSGFQPLPIYLQSSTAYINANVELRPRHCELPHSRSARGEDLLLFPTLLAASGFGPGRFIDEAANPIAGIVEACHGWTRVPPNHPQSAVSGGDVELLSARARALSSHSHSLSRYKLVAVAGAAAEQVEAAQLLTSSFTAVKHLVMYDTVLWSRNSLTHL